MTKRILHSELEREVLARLQQLGLTVESGQRVGGYEPDFVVRTADGRTIVVEVKGWIGDPSHVERAKRQVLLYQKALGADAGFVVMPSLHAGSNPDKGVLSINDLDQLPNLIGTLAQEKDGNSLWSQLPQVRRNVWSLQQCPSLRLLTMYSL